NARSMAQKIVEARRGKSLERVSDLLEVLKPSKNDLPKLFQALRIEVNREMDALEEFLQTAPRLLAPGGVLAILSYHSIEDRMVKNAFREKEAESREDRSLPVFRASKMIAPRKEETEENPRARSAKLRSLCLASNK
ncbi:MAG: 16S rRNA (cytosine(1402)-N(4))-methyltransferase, partial [Spirochaetales bacterium]|nr:16S rRNA (cytosine(1402)-N(4))-methyltransferase [Spirochaetales bacterium]